MAGTQPAGCQKFRKSRKYNIFPENSEEFRGNPVKSRKIPGISGIFSENPGKSQNFAGNSGKFTNSPGNFRKIPGKLRKSPGISGKFRKIPGISSGPTYQRAGAQEFFSENLCFPCVFVWFHGRAMPEHGAVKVRLEIIAESLLATAGSTFHAHAVITGASRGPCGTVQNLGK